MRLGNVLISSALAILAAASAAQAQVVGLPVINSGVHTGIGIAGDVGFGNADAGKGTTFGATGMIGFGPVGFTATVASYNPKAAGDNVTSYGGTANLRVFGLPLAPISLTLQAGYAHAKFGDQGYDHIPIGLGLAFRVPTPAFSVKPWIAPRVDLQHFDGTKAKFGLSAGVEVGTLSGFGVRASYDWVNQGDGVRPGVFGLGLQWVFKVPGL
ncbi:MAG: outer membrane beta-barrel protein [Gemmatimonadota bacterium]